MIEKSPFDHETRLLPGDIVFTAGSSWLSRLIRWGSRDLWESKTQVNHVGIITGYGSLLDAPLTEALWRVVTHSLWDRYAGTKTKVAIMRPMNIPEHLLNQIANHARGYTGRKYGWWKLGLHLLDRLFLGVNLFRRLSILKKYPICSFVVAEAYSTFGYYFGIRYNAAQPDDIWDYTRQSENYVVVRPLEVVDDEEGGGGG